MQESKSLMLDDLKYIHQRDGQDALGIAEKQWQQLQYSFEVDKIEGRFDNVVYAGMGGSALAALLSKSWPGSSVPFEICREYHIPQYVSASTLFIASSYSGNTEETLSALDEAESKGASIVIMAGGGKLIDIATEKNYPHLILPQVGQPRYAVLYSYKALVIVLQTAGLVRQGAADDMTKTADFLRSSVQSWLPTIPSDKNPAKKLALELAGKSIVIYGGPLMSPAAYKWKISFNENAKNIAWWGQLPEFNHNELSGWISHPVDKPYAVVDLLSNFEHERVNKRFKLTEKLLSGKRPVPNIVQAEGKDILSQLLWVVLFGDFVSIYLALVNNVNPTPVEAQEKFKKELNST